MSPARAGTEPVAPSSPLQVRRLDPNVLTLDYVDVTVAGESRENSYFFHAAQLVFKEHGLDGNPWERAVQVKDELIRRTFPADSGFEATYRFRMEERVPQPLQIVIERADRYTITCNGQPVRPTPGAWWLDNDFSKIDITAAAQVGENAVTIKASPLTVYHELEPAYVLGDFALRPTDAGFVIAPPKPIVIARRTAQERAGWNTQGCPFYGAAVAYSQQFDLTQLDGRYRVCLSDWNGSVAKVIVNEQLSGYIYRQPWECDVTEHLKKGRNQITVVVIGTLKNTLGPHHAGKLRGAAWPNMFQKGPDTGPPAGNQYDSIEYGLFAPFELTHVMP